MSKLKRAISIFGLMACAILTVETFVSFTFLHFVGACLAFFLVAAAYYDES